MKLPSFPNAAAISDTIQRALSSAGLSPPDGAMKTMQEHLQRAMSGSAPPADVIDVEAREIGVAPSSSPSPAQPGSFSDHSFSNRAGTRGYKLYLPSGQAQASQPMPLLVMLHGCTQGPDDFAAGTRMNELAEAHGVVVVYPEQAPKANGSRCWNWFKPQDQQREQGEPSLIAGITREVMAGHRIDPQRVFVAGLSAGAAMAVILGETSPELFAAIGVHSGLPYAAAHDVPSAFAAMKGSAPLPGVAARAAAPLHNAVPTIVFHGDQDGTVALSNGAAVSAQALAAWSGQGPLQRSETTGQAPGGRAWRRTVHQEAAGRPVLEDWRLHGAGHAWSGGSAAGSYTDPSGPDASAEMLRFFLAQRAR